jgi:hypothetical protein
VKKIKASSSGHKLGQLIGDWYERNVATAIFDSVVAELGLYLDHRFKERKCRGGKIIWRDLEDNSVDYDFVIELGGNDNEFGAPLAFFETFWRRGARHSKDKARDDSGKLLPMRYTYPTARVLGIVSAGDFTKPAQEYVQSRAIDLFFIPKENIVKAWKQAGIDIDYADGAIEEDKAMLANHAEMELLKTGKEKEITDYLYDISGKEIFESYKRRLIALLSAIPISYGCTSVYLGTKVEFSDHNKANEYLKNFKTLKTLGSEDLTHKIVYEALYSDGSMFERGGLALNQAIELHEEVGRVADYFKALLNK